MRKHREFLCTVQMVVDPQVELVHSSELLQEAVHGPGVLRDPAGVRLGQGLHRWGREVLLDLRPQVLETIDDASETD